MNNEKIAGIIERVCNLDGIMLEDGDIYFNGKAMNDRLFVSQLVHMIKKGEIYFGLNDMNENYNPKDYYYLKKLAGEKADE